MFLLPALVTAVASEIAYAAVATEKHTSKTETTEPYRASRRPTLINAVVDPVGYASEESPLPMSDKQVVVFGTNNHPGINTAVVGASGNYEGWTNVVRTTPFIVCPRLGIIMSRLCFMMLGLVHQVC